MCNLLPCRYACKVTFCLHFMWNLCLYIRLYPFIFISVYTLFRWRAGYSATFIIRWTCSIAEAPSTIPYYSFHYLWMGSPLLYLSRSHWCLRWWNNSTLCLHASEVCRQGCIPALDLIFGFSLASVPSNFTGSRRLSIIIHCRADICIQMLTYEVRDECEWHEELCCGVKVVAVSLITVSSQATKLKVLNGLFC